MEQVKNTEGFIRLYINGKEYKVSQNDKYNPETKLMDFIRDTAGLKGTKYLCREGGCGACVVTTRVTDPKQGKAIVRAVNSCLVHLFSCNDWEIFTVESLGCKKDGYHAIQERIVKFNATQCGFCTPAFCMSMHSLLESKSDVTMKDVEDSLDGNICRCTGYRPILDAFKSLAVDAPDELRKQYTDIEDCASCPCPLRKTDGTLPMSKVISRPTVPSVKLDFSSGQKWVKPTDVKTAFESIKSFRDFGNHYRIVAGNTGYGVFRTQPTLHYLDVSNIPELLRYTMDTSGVVLGAATTLTSTIELMKKASDIEGYAYTMQISQHLQRVANVPVRNVGTLGGNLMLKHAHNDFPSDVFVLLETFGGKINIASSSSTPKMYTMVEFLNMDMEGKLIISIYFPQRKGDYRFRTYKITRRHQNAHAYVNAGFLIKVDAEQNFKVLEKPRIVFGGIAPDFVHASGTELFLVDKCLDDPDTLRGALKALDIEINPNVVVGEASPAYRKSLTKSLLFKTILGIVEEKVQLNVKSGSKDIVRGTSKGKQNFEQDTEKTTLYKHIPKLEAAFQTSGEAEYINDIPHLPNELFGAFVLTTVAKAELKSVDPSEALKMEGVARFIDAKDIPGVNNYMIFGIFPSHTPEQIFLDNKIEAAGQPIGLILATSRDLACHAATKVKVEYKNVQKPIVCIEKALKKIEEDGTLADHTLATFKCEKTTESVATHEIKGEHRIGGQYHFHMEPHSCLCVPKEDSMDVFSGTQWMDHTQGVIAGALGVPNNYLNLQVKRIGGAFGAKLTRASRLAAACAVAAYVTNQPVRVILDMETNMNIFGKRSPYLSKYEAKFDDSGKIVDLKISSFCDAGLAANEADAAYGMMFLQNVYDASNWEVKAGFVTTNTPSNTFCRAPGAMTGVALIEYIMEHIAHKLKKDPLEVRSANYIKDGGKFMATGKVFEGQNFIPGLVEEINKSGDYDARKLAVKKFNKENRWKKRGIALTPSLYLVEYFGAVYPVYVAIYHLDGSIAVSHSGIEMGQGINTKVAQTVAHALDVPLDKVKIKPTNSLVGNNAFFSGASITSESCCNGALRACQLLIERMKPIKEKLAENYSWEKLVADCYDAKIDLSATYMHGPKDDIKEYVTWAVNITEVEVDILTGEYKVVRVDLLEDAGKSLNPAVDIGQIEGGYLFGQGLWTTENILHDENTGQLLTNRTWNYKPPESRDVPEDFRVTLLHNAPNPLGVLRSKAVAEPPTCTSVTVLFALRNAIASARKDAGKLEWFELDGPVTPEDVLKLSLTTSSQFVFK